MSALEALYAPLRTGVARWTCNTCGGHGTAADAASALEAFERHCEWTHDDPPDSLQH